MMLNRLYATEPHDTQRTRVMTRFNFQTLNFDESYFYRNAENLPKHEILPIPGYTMNCGNFDDVVTN